MPKETDNASLDLFSIDGFGKIFWLDACALLAIMHDEDGAGFVERILLRVRTHRISVFMTKINLLEVFYDIYRRSG